MKKQMNTKNAQVETKPKRTKRNHTYFLYVEGNGFLRADDDGYPTLDTTHGLLKFTERKQAVFAAKFFKPFVKEGEIAVFTNLI